MVKIFADTADPKEMAEMSRNPLVKGFTTNPTLARKAGVINYGRWAREVCAAYPDYPVSIEVLADDFDTMEVQARKIASWGENVYVKIPVTNSKGEFSGLLIRALSRDGVKVNVTAIMTNSQVYEVLAELAPAFNTPAIVSIFAGRIADTGIDPRLRMETAASADRQRKHEILWASPRQVLDVYTADQCGCDIITVSKDILAKLALKGKNLAEYSRETVEMFLRDAKASAFEI